MGLKVGYVALNQVDDDRYQYRIYSMQSTKHITLPLNQVDDNKYQYMIIMQSILDILQYSI